MRFTIIIILAILVNTSFGQTQKDSIQFSIYFADCFNSDTLTLILDQNYIFKKKVISTNKLDGITNAYVYQDENKLHFDDNKELPKIKFGDFLEFIVIVNNHYERAAVDLRKGKYILIDKCQGFEGSSGKIKLTMYQLKTAPEFD